MLYERLTGTGEQPLLSMNEASDGEVQVWLDSNERGFHCVPVGKGKTVREALQDASDKLECLAQLCEQRLQKETA